MTKILAWNKIKHCSRVDTQERRQSIVGWTIMLQLLKRFPRLLEDTPLILHHWCARMPSTQRRKAKPHNRTPLPNHPSMHPDAVLSCYLPYDCSYLILEGAERNSSYSWILWKLPKTLVNWGLIHARTRVRTSCKWKINVESHVIVS